MNLWIEPSELDAGIRGGELPINSLLRGVTPGFPSVGFPTQGVEVRNPTIQALPGEDTEFQCGDIEPTPVLGGVLQPLRQTPGGLRGEGFVKRTQFMRVAVIADQPDAVCLGILDLQEVLNLVCPVNGGALRADMHMAVALQGFGEQEDIRGAIALVLVINPRWMAGTGR